MQHSDSSYHDTTFDIVTLTFFSGFILLLLVGFDTAVTFIEPSVRIELTTYALQVRCSTTELQGRIRSIESPLDPEDQDRFLLRHQELCEDQENRKCRPAAFCLPSRESSL